jgi:hypothetical protein
VFHGGKAFVHSGIRIELFVGASGKMRPNMLRTHRYFPVLLLTIGVGIATPACAEQINGYGGGRQGSYERDLERRAYDTGYREGLQAGQNDGRRGRDFSYSRHDEYRDADDGYRRGTIDRDYYRRSFRQGFQAGYSESFNRYGRNNGRYPGDNGYPRTTPYPSDGGVYGYPSNRGVLRWPPTSDTATASRPAATTRAIAAASTRSGRSVIARATTTTTDATALARTTNANTARRSNRDTARGLDGGKCAELDNRVIGSLIARLPDLPSITRSPIDCPISNLQSIARLPDSPMTRFRMPACACT